MNDTENIMTINTPIGPITLYSNGKQLTKLDINKSVSQSDNDPVLNKTKQQLDEYFAGKRKSFDLPLAPEGTDFQKKVWKSLQKITFGDTKNYADIANDVGCPKGFRAVGNANGKNPIAIIIPCHRVIASDGSLGGFSSGLDVKRQLLAIETA